MRFLGGQNAIKYVIGWGSALDPAEGAHTDIQTLSVPSRWGKGREVFPGLMTFGGPTVADKIKQIVCPFH